MISTLIYVLFVVAAFSLVYWGVSKMALPDPVRTVLIVVMGLIGLLILWNLIAGSGLIHR